MDSNPTGSSMKRKPPQTFEALVNQARNGFCQRYGRSCRWLAAAPGRVNLIGEHTDYNGGFVLPMAIEGYTVIAADRPAEPAIGDLWQLYSEGVDESTVVAFDPSRPPPESNHWSNYVLGVLAGCQAAGLRPGPVDAWIASNVPVGGGLSSSAAIEVATATLVEAITGEKLDKMAKVRLCQRAEHDYAHMPCGIMDQFTSVMAEPDHLILLDCRSEQADMVPLADPEVTVLIINTGVKHELANGEYAKRRGQCEEAARTLGVPLLRDVTAERLEAAWDQLASLPRRRARHIVSENARTVAAAKAAAANDWPQVGTLMYASHASLRDDYEVSCKELDLLVDLAQEIGPQEGVIGARMTGGGFGGCTVSLVRTDAVDAVIATITNRYRQVTGINAAAFTTQAARGAHIVTA
jgi:galactokinase